MLQANQLIYERLANRAKLGDLIARLELTFMAMQSLEKAEVPENIAFGMSVLESLSKQKYSQSSFNTKMHQKPRTKIHRLPAVLSYMYDMFNTLNTLECLSMSKV